MKRILTFAGLGCSALLVLVVLLGIVGALVGGGGNDQASSSPSGDSDSSSSSQGSGSSQSQETTVQIGQTATVGDVAWTVTNARQATELNSQFLEPKQGNYVVVDFSFLNDGSEGVTLSQNSISLLDSQDREADPDTDTFGYIDPNKDILLKQVNPGVTQQGEVIFSVAPGSSGFRLQVGDTNPFSNQNAYVDLGF